MIIIFCQPINTEYIWLWSILYVVLCLYVLKGAFLVHIIDSLTLNLSQQHFISCLNEAYTILSVRNIKAFLCLGTLDSTVCGYHFKQWNHQQKYKNVTLNRLWKGHLFAVWDETRRQGIISFDLSWKTPGDSNFSPFYSYLWMTMKAPWVLIWGLQIILASR